VREERERPPVKVEVALPRLRREEPEMVRPLLVWRPAALTPPEKVEVLVFVTAKAPSMVVEAEPFPVTRRLP
jgi:hypothetical protein